MIIQWKGNNLGEVLRAFLNEGEKHVSAEISGERLTVQYKGKTYTLNRGDMIISPGNEYVISLQTRLIDCGQRILKLQKKLEGMAALKELVAIMAKGKVHGGR